MKNKLNLLLKIDINGNILPGKYSFFIEGEALYVLPSNPNTKDWVTDTKGFRVEYEEYLEYLNIEGGNDEIVGQSIKNEIIPNISNLISNADSITIESDDYEKIKKYIKRFNIPECKKIIITNDNLYNPDLMLSEINRIHDVFMTNKNILLEIDGNNSPETISNCVKSMQIIDDFVCEVKSLNLSPMEQLMYVYDWVRDRVYKKEDKNESASISRDLSSALLSGKIVCLGYANIFNIIAKKLGFSAKVFNLRDKNDEKHGHSRNIVYVKDDKYDINGVYLFDTTWDSKKGDNSFLNRYLCFAKTFEEFKDMDEKMNLVSIDYPLLDDSMFMDIIKRYESSGVLNMDLNHVRMVNNLSKLVDGKRNLINDLAIMAKEQDITLPFNVYMDEEYILDKLYEYMDLISTPICAEKFLDILYSVRQVQYYKDPNKFSFDVDYFYYCVCNSNWHFNNIPEAVLLNMIGFYDKNSNKPGMKKYVEDSHVDKKIARVKLSKTLGMLLEKKQGKM